MYAMRISVYMYIHTMYPHMMISFNYHFLFLCLQVKYTLSNDKNFCLYAIPPSGPAAIDP